jgi:hypothetical protein
MDIRIGIDADLHDILNNYFYHGINPGSFYKSVVHNDLRTALFNVHPCIDLKQTCSFVDHWMVEHKIDMEFLKNVD